MKRSFLFLFIVPMLILSTCGIACAEKTIIISTMPELDPVAQVALKVMTEAYKRLGITMIIKNFPGERALQTANAGVVDGELYRRKEVENDYPNLIRIPVPITVAEVVVFTKGKHFPVEGWKSIRPYKVGYIRGIKMIEANLPKGGVFEPVNNNEQAFLKLEAGRTDLVVGVRAAGLITISHLGLKGIEVLEPPLITNDLYHFLYIKNQHLVKPLTEVLQQMQKEGFIKKTIDDGIKEITNPGT